MLALQRDYVYLRESPDGNDEWGTILIKRGLKREARRGTVSITEPMAAVLIKLMSESKCEYIFSSLKDRTKKLSANTLANQHRIIKKTCSFHPGAGLHALRHSFLTEAGRHTQNVKALQNLRALEDRDHHAVHTPRTRRHYGNCARGSPRSF